MFKNIVQCTVLMSQLAKSVTHILCTFPCSALIGKVVLDWLTMINFETYRN